MEKEKRYCYAYPHPALTADIVVVAFDGIGLQMLLIERGGEPYKGRWALPGGFMEIGESIEECARRELAEETGLEDLPLEQFHVFSGVGRDPRERVVSVAFLTLVREADLRVMAGDDAARAKWFPLNGLPPLAFDHDEVIAKACERLRDKLRLNLTATGVLDGRFALADLRRIYDALSVAR